MGWTGLALVFSATFGCCPVYTLFGFARFVKTCGLMSRLQTLALAFIALLLAAGGFYYWRVAREIPVQIAALQTNVEIRVFGIGTVEAQVVSKVGFQIA